MAALMAGKRLKELAAYISAAYCLADRAEDYIECHDDYGQTDNVSDDLRNIIIFLKHATELLPAKYRGEIEKRIAAQRRESESC